MRVGAMVVGILFSIWTFFEALLITGLSGVADNDETSAAGAGGLLAAIVAGLASALVLALPLFSAILFGVAGLFSFAAASAGYGNHSYYGIVFMGLGIMALLGWIGKKKEQREKQNELRRQTERDERMEALLRQQQDPKRYPSESPIGLQVDVNQAMLTGLDSATRIAITNSIDPNVRLKFVVIGSNGTLVGMEKAMVQIPSKRKGKTAEIVTQYSRVANPRIDPSRSGGFLRYDVEGVPYQVELSNDSQVNRGIEAVTTIRQLMRTGQEDQASRTESSLACPSCGHLNVGAVKFCGECGTALSLLATP